MSSFMQTFQHSKSLKSNEKNILLYLSILTPHYRESDESTILINHPIQVSGQKYIKRFVPERTSVP